MNKKMIAPILIIGLAGIAYYGYTKGWFSKKPKADDTDTDTGVNPPPSNNVVLPTQRAVKYKIGMKRPGAD